MDSPCKPKRNFDLVFTCGASESPRLPHAARSSAWNSVVLLQSRNMMRRSGSTPDTTGVAHHVIDAIVERVILTEDPALHRRSACSTVESRSPEPPSAQLGPHGLSDGTNLCQADIQFTIGTCYEAARDGYREDAVEAVAWYTRAATAGHPQATYALGCCYAHGRGVLEDISKAIACWQRAAELGHAGAQCCLGVALSLGWGIAADAARAASWFARAAASGHAEALYNLGVCYKKGRGVAKNAALSVALLRQAAAAGHACAEA